MKDGEFVEIEYVGRIKESDEIFDLTDEKLAKENKIFNSRARYGPITVIIGAGHILKGLEEQLKELKISEKKRIELTPEKGFGVRSAKLLKTISLQEFKKRGITPVQGQFLNLGGMQARVLSISGGRVRVDFNHPLSGKSLIYDVKIIKKIMNTGEKVKSIVVFYTAIDIKEVDVKIKGSKVKINLPSTKLINPNIKKRIADEITKYVKEIKEVDFIEKFGKKS